MKAVAALRNQFGGHAVKASARPALPAARGPQLRHRRDPVLTRAGAPDTSAECTSAASRSSTSGPGARRARPRTRRDRARRAERRRARPTWSRRSATWHARLAPGRHRRPAGPAGRRAGGGPLRGRARRPRAAGRAGDRAGQGQPGPGEPGAGAAGPRRARRAAHGAVRARRTWRWSAATRPSAAGSSTTCWSPAQPRFAGGPRRLRPGAQAAQRAAGTAVPRPATVPARGATCRTLDVWDTHLAQHGAELLAGRLRAGRRRSPAATWPRRTPRSRRASRGGALDYRVQPGAGPTVRLPTGPRRRWQRAAARRAGPRAPPGGRARRHPGRPAPRRLELALGDLPAKGYASHGESWSFALALRLASYELLRADGVEPVLVLDDVFAELDAGRRRAAGRAGRAGRAGAGHRRGRRRRAGRAGRCPPHRGRRRDDRDPTVVGPTSTPTHPT